MQEQCFLIQELFLYPQIELILVIYIAHRKLENPYKELNNPLMKIGQYAQGIRKNITNLFVTSKKRNHEFANSPIHEFKAMQNVF